MLPRPGRAGQAITVDGTGNRVTSPEPAAPPAGRGGCRRYRADPLALAAFYRAAAGWEPHPRSDDGFAGLTTPDGLFVGFQKVPGYRAPTWPDQSGVPQQSHLDFDVDDLAQTEARLLALGATRPPHVPHVPDEPRWRVLLDPEGHPFCLAERRA